MVCQERIDNFRLVGYFFGESGFPRNPPSDVSPEEWQAWLDGWDQAQKNFPQNSQKKKLDKTHL